MAESGKADCFVGRGSLGQNQDISRFSLRSELHSAVFNPFHPRQSNVFGERREDVRQCSASRPLFRDSTTIWVVAASAGSTPRAVTEKSEDETYDLKWLNNSTVVFDRIADGRFYKNARVWKATAH